MRDVIFALFLVFTLVACGNMKRAEVLKPSELSVEISETIVKEFSLAEIEYCGSAFISVGFEEVGVELTDNPGEYVFRQHVSDPLTTITYSELSKLSSLAREYLDRWLLAYRKSSGKNHSLTKLMSKADAETVKFLRKPIGAFPEDKYDLLTKCESAGAELKFNQIRKMMDARQND